MTIEGGFQGEPLNWSIHAILTGKGCFRRNRYDTKGMDDFDVNDAGDCISTCQVCEDDGLADDVRGYRSRNTNQ